MEITAIPVDVYLHETWSPDREYVDGEVVERNLGERDHAAWQSALVRCLSAFRRPAGVEVFPELRMRISPTRYRIPDVMVVARSAPREQIVSEAPLLCVEILSPDDRISRVEEKLAEYFTLGIRAVWVIDPRTETAYQCEGSRIADWRAVESLTVPGTVITLTLAELIADLG